MVQLMPLLLMSQAALRVMIHGMRYVSRTQDTDVLFHMLPRAKQRHHSA